MLKPLALSFLLAASLVAQTNQTTPAANIAVRAVRETPSNLFDVGQPIRLKLNLRNLPATGAVSINGYVEDFEGKVVWRGPLSVQRSAKAGEAVANVSLPQLPEGYYELHTEIASGGTNGKGRSTFAVFPLVDRTAAAVREGGYRIGLKKWTYGAMPWHGPGVEWDEDEAMKATTRLGLQWTRDQFNWKSQQSVYETLANYPMNVILKIERFPREFFDTERYGPLEQWQKEGKPAWQIYTVPKKELYQPWLREEILKLPKEQNVFEIWNEPFNGMAAEDFATICKYIMEVMREIRPDVIIGPNLSGHPGDHGFDAKFIEAGGMEGMNMVALHPYVTPPELVRNEMRKYREWLFNKLGREVIFTVTEYGAAAHPKGGITEGTRARHVARQTLIMYGEDVKIMTPHWMGQTERDPTYREDWYGFFRANHEPTPAVITLATAARMIDTSRYVGDLWLGPKIGAMVFERDGVHTVGLWATEGTEEIEIAPDSTKLRLYNVVGTERPVPAQRDGKLKLTLTEDVQYLVGVGPALAAQAKTKLPDEHWPKKVIPRVTRVATRLAQPPVFDGKFDDWKDVPTTELVDEKIHVDDVSGVFRLGWDDNFLYVGVDIRDNEILNKNPGDTHTIFRGDSVELFISATAKEDGARQRAPDDYQFMISPTSRDGEPKAIYVLDTFAGTVEPIAGGKTSIIRTSRGWAAEIGIPWKNLAVESPRPGTVIALDLFINDTDTPRNGRFRVGPNDREGMASVSNPSGWSFLKLGE